MFESYCVLLIHLSDMAKTKSRILTHFAKYAQPSEHKSTTLSNTATRLHKVFTSLPISSTQTGSNAPASVSSEMPGDQNLEPVMHGQPGVEQPAGGVHIRTKAKRYLNSVSLF